MEHNAIRDDVEPSSNQRNSTLHLRSTVYIARSRAYASLEGSIMLLYIVICRPVVHVHFLIAGAGAGAFGDA